MTWCSSTRSWVPPKAAWPRTCMTQVTLAAATFMMQETELRCPHAGKDVRLRGVLHRAGARGGGRTVERAHHQERTVRRVHAVQRVPAEPRHREQRPGHPPGRLRRGGHHAPGAVLRAAGTVRVPAHPEGPRPGAGAHRADRMG